jgi:GDP-L-fucose synthase
VSGILGATLRQTRGQYPGVEWTFSSRADCDLRDPRACIAYMSRVRPDAILQLAAVSGGIGLSMRQPATMLRDNVLINLSVLEAARQLGIGKLVLALSSGMYPAEAPQPIAETSIHDGPAHDTNYGYAYAKRLLAPAVRAYREEFGLNVIGLVPNALYGPFDRFDQESGTVVRALIRRFHEARDGGGPVVVWGDGTPLRELTYAEDAARAFMWGLDHYDDARILNVGCNDEHSIRDIALAIADQLGIDRSRVTFDRSRPAGIPRRRTDNTEFVKRSGFRFTPFGEGLRRTVAWYVSHVGRHGDDPPAC